jgi:hypothetical protein
MFFKPKKAVRTIKTMTNLELNLHVDSLGLRVKALCAKPQSAKPRKPMERLNDLA